MVDELAIPIPFCCATSDSTAGALTAGAHDEETPENTVGTAGLAFGGCVFVLLEQDKESVLAGLLRAGPRELVWLRMRLSWATAGLGVVHECGLVPGGLCCWGACWAGAGWPGAGPGVAEGKSLAVLLVGAHGEVNTGVP